MNPATQLGDELRYDRLERQRDDLLAVCEALLAYATFETPMGIAVENLARAAVERMRKTP